MIESVSMWSFEKAVREERLTLRGFIEWAERCNLDRIELLSYFMEGESPMEIRRLLDAKKISVSCYTILTNLINPEEGDWRQFKKDVADAETLGTRFVRITGGEASVPPAEARFRIITNLQRALEVTSRSDVILVLENVGLFSCHSKDVRAIVEAINSPRLKINFDIANALLADEAPMAAFERLKHDIAFVHFKDFKIVDKELEASLVAGDQWKIQRSDAGKEYIGCTMGEGIAPLPEFINALRQDNYLGVVSLEYEGAGDFVDTEKSLHYLRSLL